LSRSPGVFPAISAPIDGRGRPCREARGNTAVKKSRKHNHPCKTAKKAVSVADETGVINLCPFYVELRTRIATVVLEEMRLEKYTDDACIAQWIIGGIDTYLSRAGELTYDSLESFCEYWRQQIKDDPANDGDNQKYTY
jgi:hypothetical protein